MPSRSSALLLLPFALAACGTKGEDSVLVAEPVETCPSDVRFVDDPACYCELHPSRPKCADSGDTGFSGRPLSPVTLTMDVRFGFDRDTGRAASLFNPFTGIDQISYFAVNLGGSTWDGDTGLPGRPNNWCFVLWDLDRLENKPLGPEFQLSLVDIEAIDGLSNCGQDSSPGANDSVHVDGSFFGGADPVAKMSAYDFSLHFGQAVPVGMNGVINQFVGIGYEEDNFWTAEVRSTLPFGGSVADGLGYAWSVDDQGQVIQDADGNAVLYTRDTWLEEGTPKSGLYLLYVPWILRVR